MDRFCNVSFQNTEMKTGLKCAIFTVGGEFFDISSGLTNNKTFAAPGAEERFNWTSITCYE